MLSTCVSLQVLFLFVDEQLKQILAYQLKNHDRL